MVKFVIKGTMHETGIKVLFQFIFTKARQRTEFNKYTEGVQISRVKCWRDQLTTVVISKYSGHFVSVAEECWVRVAFPVFMQGTHTLFRLPVSFEMHFTSFIACGVSVSSTSYFGQQLNQSDFRN